MFEDFGIELDYTTLAIAIVLSGIFIAMIWFVPLWGTYPLSYKIIMTLMLPPISYFIVHNKMNS